MMHSRRFRTIAAILACAVVGAVAGIAVSAAAPSGKSSTQGAQGKDHRLFGPHGFGPPGFAGAGLGGLGLGGLGIAGAPVHADAVVPNGSGGFENVTFDQGTVQSVSGNDLTITEGTKSATYKTVTITVPSGAKIVRNGSTAALSALQKNDRAVVIQASRGTRVLAFTPGQRPFPFPSAAPGNVKAYKGTVKSVAGDQLTINTPGQGTVSITVPSGATVVRNGSSAPLSSLQQNDDVIVVQTPNMTRVMAFAPGQAPAYGPGPGRFGPRPAFPGGGWPGHP
jgi:hypothetical protein